MSREDNIFRFLLYIFFASLLLLSCSENKAVPKQKADSLQAESLADQISREIKVVFNDSSFTKAILRAGRARVFNENQETLLDGGLEVEFMSKESGKRVSLLTADSARIDDRTKNMLAMGDVVVTSDSTNTRLETSLLEWNNSTQRLYSTEFVRITSPYEILTGYGFESDQHLTNYKILRVSNIQRTDKTR